MGLGGNSLGSFSLGGAISVAFVAPPDGGGGDDDDDVITPPIDPGVLPCLRFDRMVALSSLTFDILDAPRPVRFDIMNTPGKPLRRDTELQPTCN